jgi:aconitase B
LASAPPSATVLRVLRTHRCWASGREQVKVVNTKAADVYSYMNFDKIAEFSDVACTVTV